MLSLPELLSYIEDTVSELICADEETCQIAYHELKESLKIVYTLNCLHPKETATILQALDECYATLADAIDRNPGKGHILIQSLFLFTSGRNYDHEALILQPLQSCVSTAPSDELKSTIETTDADLVYIQDNVPWNVEQDAYMTAIYTPSRLLYSTSPSQNLTPKILIIRSGNSEYSARGGVDFKLGGKDHGKFSLYVEGEIKDKEGNYAKGKISKEKGSDGYDCNIEGGKEKKKK